MILHICEKGHYYDCDKFASCPYCAMENNIGKEQTGSWSTNSYDITEGTLNSNEKQTLD